MTRNRGGRGGAGGERPADETPSNPDSDLVFGRNAVVSFLEEMNAESERDERKGSTVNKIFMADGLEHDGRLSRIRQIAKDHRIPVVAVDRRKLDQMLGRDARHQGVACQISPAELIELSEFLEPFERDPEELKKNPVVVIVDGIEDPHNLGAIIRVAEAAGARALLLPARRSAQVTGTVSKVSAGALATLPLVRIHNLTRALTELKEAGFWIVGLDVGGLRSLFDEDLQRPVALVVGSEQKGISRLVLENCDLRVKIPMLGKTESLNASVACGVVLFECVRQRLTTRM